MRFAAEKIPPGRRGFYTGEPGDVSAELWLLRAWCRARGGVARMGDAPAARLQQLEGDRDVAYRQHGSVSAGEPPEYLADMKPHAIPAWPVWWQLLRQRPDAAPAVASAARQERASVGLTWNCAVAGWQNLDQERLLAALEKDAAGVLDHGERAAEQRREVLGALQEFRDRHGVLCSFLPRSDVVRLAERR